MQKARLSTVAAMTECAAGRLAKENIVCMVREEPPFIELFISCAACIDQSYGLVLLTIFLFSPDCIIDGSGYNFQKEQMILAASRTGVERHYFRGRWRRMSPYSCQIRPITTISNKVKMTNPGPCV
jgi:hypothetical protein